MKKKSFLFSVLVILTSTTKIVIAYSCDDDNIPQTPSVFVESESVCNILQTDSKIIMPDRYSNPDYPDWDNEKAELFLPAPGTLPEINGNGYHHW